jgi:hypothetical protein
MLAQLLFCSKCRSDKEAFGWTGGGRGRTVGALG